MTVEKMIEKILIDRGKLVRFRREEDLIKIQTLSDESGMTLTCYEPFKDSEVEGLAKEKKCSLEKGVNYLFGEITREEEWLEEQETPEDKKDFVWRCLETFPELLLSETIPHSEILFFHEEVVDFIQCDEEERLIFF